MNQAVERFLRVPLGLVLGKMLKDSLGKLAIASFGHGTDCKGLRWGRFFLAGPELPPSGRVEFGEGFQLELIDHLARKALTGQDAVLRPQVGIGNSVEFIHFLNRGNVRILFLDFQQDLSAVDGLLFESGDKNGGKQNQEHHQDSRQPFAKDAPIAEEVERLTGFQDFVGIRQLYEPSIEGTEPAPIETISAMAATIKLDLILVVHILTNGK